MPQPLSLDTMQTNTAAALAPSLSPAVPIQPDQKNYQAATSQMNLTPQEQQLYQLHLKNLYGPGGVDNDGSNPNLPAGSRSTLYQITAEIGGKTYVIPTVWGGKIVSPDQAVQLAKQQGLDQFPTYATEDEAEARYQQMHKYMEADTAAYLAGKK